jgi:hypothetical protein
MTELHRPGFAPVFATDADLQGGPGLAACFYGENDQLANPFLVKDLERVVR